MKVTDRDIVWFLEEYRDEKDKKIKKKIKKLIGKKRKKLEENAKKIWKTKVISQDQIDELLKWEN